MNKNVNAFTTETLRRKGIQRDQLKLLCKQKFEAELTIRAGKVVWDLNGISAVKFRR